jgi:hypothetical protein
MVNGISNREEKMVFEYLLSQGFKDIQHEPNCQGNNCNIPPDFSIKGNIGIEVRRLNRHFNYDNKDKALEEVEYNLMPKINKLLKSYSNYDFAKSALVKVRYSRPIDTSKHIINKLKTKLDEHLPNIGLANEFQIGNLDIIISPTSLKLESAYQIFSEIDNDSSGFLVSDVYRNLKIVIREKEELVRPQYDKYGSWWLILIDEISFGLAEQDLQQLNSMSPINHCFDRILLLSPLDTAQAKEVKL